jgi:hypothetical protein
MPSIKMIFLQLFSYCLRKFPLEKPSTSQIVFQIVHVFRGSLVVEVGIKVLWRQEMSPNACNFIIEGCWERLEAIAVKSLGKLNLSIKTFNGHIPRSFLEDSDVVWMFEHVSRISAAFIFEKTD